MLAVVLLREVDVISQVEGLYVQHPRVPKSRVVMLELVTSWGTKSICGYWMMRYLLNLTCPHRRVGDAARLRGSGT